MCFPKPTAQGSRLVGSGSRSRLRIARRQLPYHWQALLGSSMGPKTQRRHVNDTVGDVARGKPYHWQAFAASCIFRRRTANDAVVTTDCGLPHHWHDIGTEFLIFHCFATKMLLLFCKSMIPVRFCTVFPLHSCAGIKTRFKALLKTQYLTLGPNF